MTISLAGSWNMIIRQRSRLQWREIYNSVKKRVANKKLKLVYQLIYESTNVRVSFKQG